MSPRTRPSGDGALYELKGRGLWRGVIDNGFKPDGKRDQRYVHGKTEAITRTKLNKLKAELEAGTVIDKTTTLATWAETWLRTVCQPNMKPNGLAAYESVTRQWIVKTIGRKRVAELKPSDVRLVLKAVNDAGLATATSRKVYNVMNRMLEAARLDGLATTNVCGVVRPPTVRATERGALTPAQARAILRITETEPQGSKWWVTLYGGLRQSERLGARWESINWDTGTLTVEWTLDEIPSEHGCGPKTTKGWPCGMKRGASCPQAKLKIPDGFEYIPVAGRLNLIRPKSGRKRYVPLHPQVIALLEQWRHASENQPNDHGLIWHNNGKPVLPHEDQTELKDILTRAGITEPVTSHWLRHTTATLMMEQGVDTKIIGEIVGHQNESTTRGYQHVSSEAARDAMNRIGTALNG